VVVSNPLWQNVQVYQTLANSPCPHIIAVLLLVSRMDYTILLLLVLVVNTDGPYWNVPHLYKALMKERNV
jgi:hypothetical protein